MTDLMEIVEGLRSERVTWTALADGSGVLLDLDGLAVHSLNATGMFVVEALVAGAATEDGLVRRLVAEFEVDDATARADLAAFLAELGKFLAECGSKSSFTKSSETDSKNPSKSSLKNTPKNSSR